MGSVKFVILKVSYVLELAITADDIEDFTLSSPNKFYLEVWTFIINESPPYDFI